MPPESDIPAVLRAVREQLAEAADEVHVATLPRLQRLKDAIAGVSARAESRAEVEALLQYLRARVSDAPTQATVSDVGTVQRVGDGVTTLSGLPGAKTDELVTFPTGVTGMILNLDQEHTDVILLGPDEGIQGGDLVTGTGRRLRVPVGRKLVGRIVDPLGRPLDERGTVQEAERRHLEREAPGIVQRVPVSEPLHSGTKIVDALVPIGRGQRELIIGDRQIGKTALAMDAILSQRDGGVICVYVAIGQKKSSTLEVIETLREHDALSYTIVLVSSPDDPPALRYLAPYAGCSMAEFFMDEGDDVLVVYDDLSKHADAYRELSLLLRRPPGREAYPGDIFYLHARLLERACKLKDEAGGGSLTALPIVETKSGNISAYIPTNLIAITDGQIVLDTELFNRGVKPAVDVGLSVSRVGGAAQGPMMRKLAGTLRLELSQFEEVSRFARFGAEVDESTRRQIQRGQRLRAVLAQPPHRPMSPAAEALVLLAATEGVFDRIALTGVPDLERRLVEHVRTQTPELFQELDRRGDLSLEMRQQLDLLFEQVVARVVSDRNAVATASAAGDRQTQAARSQ